MYTVMLNTSTMPLLKQTIHTNQLGSPTIGLEHLTPLPPTCSSTVYMLIQVIYMFGDTVYLLFPCQVKFAEGVQWMTLEFDPRCGFSQREDKIGELLIPRGKNGFNTSRVPDKKQDGEVSELVGLPFDSLYADWERYSLESPPGLVLVPGGGEIHAHAHVQTYSLHVHQGSS